MGCAMPVASQPDVVDGKPTKCILEQRAFNYLFTLSIPDSESQSSMNRRVPCTCSLDERGRGPRVPDMIRLQSIRDTGKSRSFRSRTRDKPRRFCPGHLNNEKK